MVARIAPRGNEIHSPEQPKVTWEIHCRSWGPGRGWDRGWWEIGELLAGLKKRGGALRKATTQEVT